MISILPHWQRRAPPVTQLSERYGLYVQVKRCRLGVGLGLGLALDNRNMTIASFSRGIVIYDCNKID